MFGLCRNMLRAQGKAVGCAGGQHRPAGEWLFAINDGLLPGMLIPEIAVVDNLGVL